MSTPPPADESKAPKNTSPNPFVLVAFCSGGSSTLIAFLALINFPHVTGDASVIWAVTSMIAAMVLAPALMGIGVAWFMSKR